MKQPLFTKIHARAPTRVDLAGGTLDLWPVHNLLDRKATVNVAVQLHAQVDLRASEDDLFHLHSADLDKTVQGSFKEIVATDVFPLAGLLLQALWREDLPPLSISTKAKSPAGAGLGGSSCLGVTIAGAVVKARQIFDGSSEDEAETTKDHKHPQLGDVSEDQLVRTVQDVESRLICAPPGCQDYWGAMRGGINIIRFPYGQIQVETLTPSHGSDVDTLNEQMILCYSGRSRDSAINNWEVFKRVFDGDSALLETFQKIGATGEDCAAAIKAQDFSAAVDLSKREWDLRLQLWPKIETAETKKLDQAARSSGAHFTRVCGAGGGGVMVVFAPQDARQDVEKAMIEAGGTILPAGISTSGLVVERVP